MMDDEVGCGPGPPWCPEEVLLTYGPCEANELLLGMCTYDEVEEVIAGAELDVWDELALLLADELAWDDEEEASATEDELVPEETLADEDELEAADEELESTEEEELTTDEDELEAAEEVELATDEELEESAELELDATDEVVDTAEDVEELLAMLDVELATLLLLLEETGHTPFGTIGVVSPLRACWMAFLTQ
jgi:hypothetical protein